MRCHRLPVLGREAAFRVGGDAGDRDESAWSIIFPQFPGVTPVAKDRQQVIAQARDAPMSAIEDRLEHGEAVPPAFQEGGTPEFPATGSPGAVEWSFGLLPVDVRGPSVRINMSMESSLLARID